VSDPWFPDISDEQWLIRVPDPARAEGLIKRISNRISDPTARPLSIQLDEGGEYGHEELVDAARRSLELMADTLAGDRADEEVLDDLAAAVNNLRIVAFAIALTDGGAGEADSDVMGVVSYLSRLLEEIVGALDRSVTPLPDGRFRVRWRATDRQMVQQLAAELDDALEADDPHLTRLFPPAYGTDEVRSHEYDAIARHELIDSRRAALAVLREAMVHPELDADQLGVLMRSINDLRLLVGTRLDVSEDVHERVSSDDPNFADWLAYDRLTHLLAQIIQALG
jgi:hypothetical protein